MSSVRQRLGVRDIARLNQIGGIEAATAHRAHSAENADRARLAEKADLATKAIQADLAENSTRLGDRDSGFWSTRISQSQFSLIYSDTTIDGKGVQSLRLSRYDNGFSLYLVTLERRDSEPSNRQIRRSSRQEWIGISRAFYQGSPRDDVQSSNLIFSEDRMSMRSINGWWISKVHRLCI